MSEVVFVAGTDTEVGKTHVSCLWMKEKQQNGLTTLGLKPISAGCLQTSKGRRNEDACLLQEVATIKAPYEAINPVAFLPPISPNIAANQEKRQIEIETLASDCQKTLQHYPADFCLIESAGGWYSPITDHSTMADLAKTLGFPVLLVVGLRLGCLNHAQLTWKAMQASGLPIHGWVANHVDPEMLAPEENLQTLRNLLGEPPLAIYPWKRLKRTSK